jgi:hypothetical protein
VHANNTFKCPKYGLPAAVQGTRLPFFCQQRDQVKNNDKFITFCSGVIEQTLDVTDRKPSVPRI